MFVRIYSGILISTLISISCCYAAYQYIDQVRTANYTLNLFSGTQQLITEGVNRHSGEKQRQWVSLVQKLIGLPINLIDPKNSSLNQRELEKLNRNKILIQTLEDGVYSQIWTQASNSKLIRVKLKNVAEQQLRITAFLILNEIGRYPRSKQLDQLSRLKQYFHFDINILLREKLQLDKQQLKRLERGDVVVAFSKNNNSEDVLEVFSRYKSTRQYLAIGPIPTYNASPLWLLATLISIAFCVTGLIIYFLVKRLEKRIRDISNVVTNFGPETISMRVDSKDTDSIGELATGIDVMASRIENLLNDQQEITQAISHELRTPISRMKFRIEILLESLGAENPATQDKLNKLTNDIRELDLLVEELLAFQMLDSSKSDTFRQVDLAKLINAVVAEIYEPFQEIELQLFIPDVPVLIQGDSGQLRRLLQNLLVNAFKHAKNVVRLTLLESPIIVMVSDDGDGIPKEHRERIFTPFVRLDSSRNRKTGGFGLGLAIIERISRLHNASVLASEPEIGGATFVVRFGEKEEPINVGIPR